MVVNYDNTINAHHDIKRQPEAGIDCQCKDGTPGPIGPPGKKEIREHLEYQDQKEILDQEETLVIGDQED